MLLLWPGEVRRKGENELGWIGPVLFAGTNISDLSKKKISSTSYCMCATFSFMLIIDCKNLLEWIIYEVVTAPAFGQTSGICDADGECQ